MHYKKGVQFALITALLSGLANFLNKEIIISGVDPISLVFIKNFLVGAAFLAITFFSFKKIKKIQIKDSWKLLVLSLFGGSIAFILFFKGLALTSAINASFIHKTMFVWATLLAWPFLGEKISKWQIMALSAMTAGVALASSLNAVSLGGGELMIMAATWLWSLEIIFVKKFAQNLDFKILAAARMFGGSLLIAGFVFLHQETIKFSGISPANWMKLLIVSLFLFSFVYFWYRALSLAPANLVTSILVLAFPITIITASAWEMVLPPTKIILGIFLVLGAVISLIALVRKQDLWPKLLTHN